MGWSHDKGCTRLPCLGCEPSHASLGRSEILELACSNRHPALLKHGMQADRVLFVIHLQTRSRQPGRQSRARSQRSWPLTLPMAFTLHTVQSGSGDDANGATHPTAESIDDQLLQPLSLIARCLMLPYFALTAEGGTTAVLIHLRQHWQNSHATTEMRTTHYDKDESRENC